MTDLDVLGFIYPMLPFPSEKIKTIKSAIDNALDSGANPIAAFDADGTLWSCDIGVDFFHYQIQNRLIPGLPPEPFDHYKSLFGSIGDEDALFWLAQINEGFTVEQVRKWAKAAVDEMKQVPLLHGISEIIDHLHKRNVEVYVVTASTKFSVEPAAALYGIPAERVIGIEAAVKNGVITKEKAGVVTWKQGKVDGLLAKTKGKHAFFCAGNTEGDLKLLESSTNIRLCVASAPERDFQHRTEKFMQNLAKERGWYYHDYTSGTGS